MAVTDWIQPDDTWVALPTTVTSDVWYRNVGWDPDGLDEAATAAEFAARWTDTLELPTGDFAALAGTGDIHTAEESVSRNDDFPFTQYQNLSTSHQSWLGFVELAAASPTEYPLYEPSLGPGETVEYEATEGAYLGDYRYEVPADTDGVFTDGHVLPSLLATNGSGVVGSLVHPRRVFDTWDTVVAELTAPYNTFAFVRTADTVTVVALFGPQISGVPRDIDPNSGLVTLARWAYDLPRPFAASRLYRPPRYRIRSGSGEWELRQRQNNSGNAGGWPLRHRQTGNASGSWPLRHRQ